MFEKKNFFLKEPQNTESFPLIIRCEYGGAIFTFVCAIALWVAAWKGWIFDGTIWLKKYALVFALLAGSIILLKQYYFAEKRLQMKILGITIRDVPRKDIMQIGIITHSYGAEYLLIILQTAPQYTPNRFGTYKKSYLLKYRRDIFLIRYKPQFDRIIQMYYGDYDFIEDNKHRENYNNG